MQTPARHGIPVIRYTTIVGAVLIAMAALSGGAVNAGMGSNEKHSAFHPDNQRPDGSVWVVNRDLGELAVFDAATGRVIATRKVGAGAHDICISERTRTAFITAESIDTVTAVDTRTLMTTPIAVGPLPHHIEPSGDGRTIYVSLASHTAAFGAPQLATIDTADYSVDYVTTSSNPLARSHAPQLSHDGHSVYVAHDLGDELTALDTPTGTIDFSVGSIPKAEEALASRFGTFLWVSSRADGTVKRIKIGRNAVTKSIPVGVQPESLMLTPSEETLVVSLRGTPAALAFVDTTSLAFERTVQIGATGTSGDLAVMTPDGRYVYATYDAGTSGAGGVAVVHVPTRRVVAIWPYPGTGRPHGVWYSPRRPRF